MSHGIDEKGRRVYYQDLVYQVCNMIDRFDGQAPGGGIVCGTAGSQSTELQSRMKVLLDELRQLRGSRMQLRFAAAALLAKMDEVEIDQDLGEQTDRVFGRFEFEDLRIALTTENDWQ